MLQLLKDNSLWILLAVGTAFSCYWLIRNKDKIKIEWWSAVILAILHTVIGVLSVKAFAVIETLDFSRKSGMSLFGGVFFMPVLYIIGAKLFKRKVGTVTDVFTPCMIFTVMCARVNCIIAGCCLGAFVPGTSFRYPTRELEIVFYIILLSYFLFWQKKLKPIGSMYPLYMALYGVFRFVCEFFRYSSSGSVLHISHLWALISFMVGVAIYSELTLNKKSNKKK